MNRVRTLYDFLLLLIIFFIPFSDFHGLSYLGELKGEAHIYFLLLYVFIFFLTRTKLTLPVSYYWILLFILMTFIISFFSIEEILYVEFKGKSGIEKFIFQELVLIMYSSLFVLVVFNHLKEKPLAYIYSIIYNAVFISFIVVFIYAAIEILYLNSKSVIVYNALEIFNSVLNKKQLGYSWSLNRISSITAEPSFLGMYLIFAFPWLINHNYSKKYFRIIILISVAVIIYFAGSRVAYIVFLIQLILWVSTERKIHLLKGKNILVFITASVFFILFNGMYFITQIINNLKLAFVFGNSSFSAELTSAYSRWGTQIASFKIFIDNYLIGVGYGQQGYYLRQYYPDWSYNSFEIQNWSSNSYPTWPPGFSLFARIAAELGIVGLIYFLFLLVILFFNFRRLQVQSHGNRLFKCILNNSFIVYLGYIINFFQIDTFRIVGFWLSIAIMLVIKYKFTHEKSSSCSFDTSL